MIRRRGVLLLAACLVAAPLAAQGQGDLSPWRLSWFPYVTLSPNDGVMAVAHAILFRQADWDDRVSLRDAVTVDAGFSTRNAWLVQARGDFPRLADGWRLQAVASASRSPRFGDPDSAQDLARQAVGLTVSRRVAGRLNLAVRGGAEHLRDRLTLEQAAALHPGATVESPCFLVDPQPGTTCDAATLRQTDATAGATLVLDLRDREYNPLTGALVEAGVFAGSAADGYHGAYAQVKGWLSPGESTHLTARLGLRATSSAAAIGISHTMPAWEAGYTTFGGAYSQRGLPEGRSAGRGLLLAGGEVRQDIFRAKNIAAVSLIAFVDGGRVFQDSAVYSPPCPSCNPPQDPRFVRYDGGRLRLTFDGWTVSAGGGVAVRLLRNAILTVTAARGEGKTRWYVSTGWGW